MAAEFTGLTHNIAIQLHLVWQRAVPFAVLAPGGQSGNFWIHPLILLILSIWKFIENNLTRISLGIYTQV
jgi:hypothetical protein